jgi:signal transduction histidine kinase
VAGVVLLVALYYTATRVSYGLHFAGETSSILWLSTGLGIAFLYLAGIRFWPGVLVAELLTENVPVGQALGVTIGNTVEVVLATLLLRQLVRRGRPLDTVRGVAGMVTAIAVGLAVGATISTLTLRLSHVVTTSGLPDQWREWWLSAFAGALLVVPLALAWYPWPHIDLRRRPSLDAILPLAAVVGSSALVFQSSRPWAYLVFPALLWSALRLGQRGGTVAVAVAAGFAVWATVHLLGPFHFYNQNSSVLETLLFIVAAAISTAFFTALVTDRERLARALGASLSRVVESSDRERRRLERDLHDGAQQRLVAASINLSLAGELADGNPQLHERVSEACAEVDAALAELREVAHGIYPQALGRWGLARAFDVLAARYPGRVEIIGATAARFPAEVEAAMYYCCTEAVQNAFKHAGPDGHISIRLYTKGDRLDLDVRDNGPGFDVAAVHDGVGLQNMRDRLGAVRGTVEIVSEPGHGTLVAATSPLRRPT